MTAMNMTERNNHIILVEDDPKLSRLIKAYLEKQGYRVTDIDDGLKAAEQILAAQPLLVILDLMLPGQDGLSICREIRPHFNGGILMLTASDDDMDQVAGLELGADDYVVKPIHPRVLLARIRTLVRHKSTQPTTTSSNAEQYKKTNNKEINFGQLRINTVQRQVSWQEQSISLTPSEFEVLLLLASHPEQIFSRDDILKQLRGIEYDGMDRSVDVKISNLRRKFADNSASPKKIITVRGKGYLLAPDSF